MLRNPTPESVVLCNGKGFGVELKNYRVVKGGGSLIFPNVPQSSLGILRVPQLPPP